MDIQIEYKHDGESRRVGVDNLHAGRPLAENVRRALDSIPDGGYAVAVWVDGKQVL